MRGLIASVYRGAADRYGDREGTHIGDIPGCIFAPDGYTIANRQDAELSTTEPTLFAPRRDPIKLRDKDRVKITQDGVSVTYRVVGPKTWDHAHPLTGKTFSRYSVSLQAAL
jgi:hypothetical protein